MKIFLFLYPIKQYFKSEINNSFLFRKKNHDPKRINSIINARYREKGYQMAWLMFSDPNEALRPDISSVSDYVEILKDDIIIVSGVSFEKHLKEKKYPEYVFILAQMPHTTELVLGGFHQWDCVDKLAEHAYRSKISTRVDEDTTELFFLSTVLKGEIPLIRKKFTLKDMGINNQWLIFAKKARRGKPWFLQT